MSVGAPPIPGWLKAHTKAPSRNPRWCANEPADDAEPRGRAHRCLTCRARVKRRGLCAGMCFFRFWEVRLQAQQGRWQVRDKPKVWYAKWIGDNAWGGDVWGTEDYE